MALGFVLAAHLAHYFLSVLESTAAGHDDVSWPDEPFLDWFWKVFFLSWLGLLAAVPAASLVLSAREAGPWSRLGLAAGSFWLLLPIGLLSNLSAASQWTAFSPALVERLGQRAGKLLLMYLASAPALAAWFAAAYLAVVRESTSLGTGVALAPVAAAASLVYARVVGRYAFVLSFTKGRKTAQATAAKRRGRSAAPKLAVERSEALGGADGRPRPAAGDGPAGRTAAGAIADGRADYRLRR